ncbi:hypothetical protein RFI_20663 [Reticulomyxa filosa]|uniref:Uncharacterized protein n=1 Tax=Reticulomyxa filosa TaxID=46433 RepID=X6MT94_RETFI|nr:hypothetical protein RFI_20663 [Reticulomyxa filosa]|eukprot:ETO16677.1 hypothetical protein RFI_20663 [Reticulomyxa filosa]
MLTNIGSDETFQCIDDPTVSDALQGLPCHVYHEIVQKQSFQNLRSQYIDNVHGNLLSYISQYIPPKNQSKINGANDNKPLTTLEKLGDVLGNIKHNRFNFSLSFIPFYHPPKKYSKISQQRMEINEWR